MWVTILRDLWPSLDFSPDGRYSFGCGVDAGDLFGMYLAVFGTDRLEPMLWSLNHAALLMHDPFEIRFGQSSLTTWLKWLMYQCLKGVL